MERLNARAALCLCDALMRVVLRGRAPPAAPVAPAAPAAPVVAATFAQREVQLPADLRAEEKADEALGNMAATWTKTASTAE